MAARFLHAADLHLDTPFTARGRYPEHVAAVLRDASLGAFGRLIDAALAHQVAFVVFAGDIYDGADRGLRAQIAFRDGLARLDAAGIRAFVAHGNHDPVEEGWTAIKEFPALVTVFPAGEVASVSFEVEGGGPVTVHGISFATAHEVDNLALRFTRPATPGLHVGVLHANVGADPAHDPYSPCSVADLRAVGLDYWALGHVHARRVLHREPWIVYPGNLQGRTIRATEAGPKGALLVDISAGRVSEPQLLACDLVRFASVEVDATGLEADGLLAALLAAGDDARAEAEGRSVLLGATIVGRGGLHERLRSTSLATELRAELRAAAGTATPFLWWDDVAVATRAEIDTAALRDRDDFLADVVGTSERLGAALAADDPRLAWVEGVSADILRLASASGLLPTVDELWAEATELALDLLLDGPS